MNADQIMDYVVECAAPECRVSWIYLHWRTPDSLTICLWCGASFCSQRCHDEHHPCEEHPGPCPNRECESEDGLEPLGGDGLICGDCRQIVETGRG